MSGVPGWQEAVALPWLRPSAAALLALTADPPDERALLADPAAVAHILRFARPTPGPHDPLFSPRVLGQPSLLSNAALLLEESRQDDPDWIAEPLSRVNRVVDPASRAAAELARESGRCSPDVAEAVTRLTALGWYALYCVEPDAVAGCLTTAGRPPRRGLPRTSMVALTRRLAGRWRIPQWATATIGYLHLRPEDAIRMGAPEGLFAVAWAAVAAAERVHGSLGLTDPKAGAGSASLLERAECLVSNSPPVTLSVHRRVEAAPKPLLVRLLNATAAARRASGVTWLAEAEDRVDALGAALADLRANFDTAVRDAKLAALAEFAAGASHEINNPLAVISGHAQLLLNREPDPERRKQLGAIVRQTKRIHDLLQGTLQFARPSRPSPAGVRVGELVEGVASEFDSEAATKDLRLVIEPGIVDAEIRADVQHARQALVQVVRNAIASAPDGGWVALRVESAGDEVELVVEDNGPGPSPTDLDHLFDPFYSGRTAGRGRGLGLSIAWRYTSINGGDLRYEPVPGGPTRFVLTFPLVPAPLPGHVEFGRKVA